MQAFAAEARLLAQPVSLELRLDDPGGEHRGPDDDGAARGAPARREAELGARVVAVELLLAAQACELRGQELGAGTAGAQAAVRDVAPFVGEGDGLPDLEPLALVRSGRLSRVA